MNNLTNTAVAFDQRAQLLQAWLQQQLLSPFTMMPLAGDASFRRYFRIQLRNTTAVAMDAPVEREDIKPYIKIATALLDHGLCVPVLQASDLQQGFLLLSDLGDDLLLKILRPENAIALYNQTIDSLVRLQTCNVALPAYSETLLRAEMQLFIDWYLIKHRNLTLTTAELQLLQYNFDLLVASALAQPQVCVHRDYHSRNLLLTQQQIGILDFQDAVIGPITYDLVSLLRDCYITWPEEKIAEWINYYLHQAEANGVYLNANKTQFRRWFDWMGLQRHLKCAGIFARLYHRDHKPGYLGDIPRVLNYLLAVSEVYPELNELHQFLQTRALA